MEYFSAIPNITSGEYAGLVYYFPSAIFGLADKPTNYGDEIMAVASVYCMKRFIFVVGNYLGYNQHSSDFHPHVTSAQTNIKSAIFVLNDFYQNKLKFDKRVNQTTSLRMYLTGFSSGSNYAAMFYSSPHFTILNKFYLLSGVALVGGLLDLNDTMISFLTQDVSQLDQNKFNVQQQSVTNFAKAPLGVMAMKSFTFFDTANTSL